jgi:hypothetical protein
LLPGEKVHAVIYEPAIRQSGIHLNPYLSPNRVVVLTDQNVIVIEDAQSHAAHSVTAMYQYERCFCPRSRVIDVQFETKPDVTWVQFQLGTVQARHAVRFPLLPARAAALQTALSTWYNSERQPM